MKRLLKLLICLLVGGCATIPTFAFADGIEQNIKENLVSGVIVDVEGIPMPGVNVRIMGTSTGVISDIDGKYELVVPQQSVIVYSFVGYQTQEIAYKNQKNINIVLREATQELSDVVVVGYGNQKKTSVTGALTLAKPVELQKTSTPSLSNTLGGMVSGVITRQSSGEPGYDQAEILIRGVATWANKSPLVLVDGVERDINLINSQEIESFTILKDASATAVYGVRGANGVILINTKRGKMGKPQVTLRTEFATLRGLRFPEYINGYEFAGLMNEAVSNSGNTTALPWTEEELEMFRNGTDPYLYPNVNWTDEVLNRNAFQTINNLSVTGGNEIVRYFINVGYTSQSGLFKEDPQYKYRTNSLSSRYNFRSNVDVNITKDLILNLGLGGIIEDRTYPGRPAGDIFAAMKKISPIAYARQNPDGSPGGGVSYLMDNPWAMTTQSGYAKQFRNTLQGTFGAKYDLSKLVTKGLFVQGKFSYDYYYFNEVFRRKEYEVKQYLGKDEKGEDKYNVVRPERAMGYEVSQNSNRAYYMEASVNYERDFGNHHVASMLLFNRRDYKNLTAGNSTSNLPYRRQGLAGRFTYDFSRKYLFEFNFGYNGSENFPKGKRYGFFPSGSFGWIVSNEKFWKIPFINHFKLRGTYGTVGNDQVGGDRFLYLSTIDKGVMGYPFGDSQQWIGGFSEAKLGVNNITWEVARKTNVGIDIEFLNGLVSLQGDFFWENRDDILLKRGVIPNISGITSATIPWANLGKVKNKGFDGTLEIKNTTKRGFYYSFRANFTYARNQIIENDTAIPKYAYQDTRGHRVDQPFGLVALGLFQSQEEIDNSPEQTFMSVVRPGDIKYKDMNGDNRIDAYDRIAIGYGRTPEIMFGFGGTVAYKGIDITLNFTGATHTSTFLDTEGMYPFMLEFPNYNILREYYDNRWIPGADNSKAKYPAVINGNNPNNFQTNTLYMRNAEYIKLKNAEIGYNFSEAMCKRMRLDGLRVFVNGNNLLCFDHLKIIDPESNFGTGGYPTQRAVNFGLQVNF
ncbi:MAG: TonB-dependent receptor [Bacteroides sp.]|uniref:SusC/RagA family TonB-linked outer membrane protein n=1 Tax=Bacteroides sp. TaxID=29523 RepID=UPI0026E09953|nr:TonB-dependent receptor [Bacteroides sp.]MDO5420877.1 TonB-dependent receptor [Bacteroides sp.]